ncbi:MAG: hypothetical protein F2712_02560, partial [Actinobacteria bacterium]|nr:hypothetical protein [Actinomycetota bacterium]
MLALLEIFGVNHPPSLLRHRPHLISLSTQNSLSEKTLAQIAEIFATPVGSRVVLDTSVLVADPNCLTSFPNCAIVIPLTVIEELDGLKTRMDDVGRSARSALRSIEDLRRKAGGSLKDPTPINGTKTSGTVQIEVNGIQNHLLIEHGLDPKVPDNRIIGAALGQAAISPTCIVSNDAALRIK